MCESTGQQRRAVHPFLPRHFGKFVGAGRCENSRECFLVRSQHVDGERPDSSNLGPRRARSARREGNEDGINAERSEALTGESEWSVLSECGDDDDSRRKVANDLAVVEFVNCGHRGETTARRRYGDVMANVQVGFDDVVLDCEIDGPSDGPLAICLHGFPDTRATYRHLVPVLHELGYRTVVPAMRGFAPSSIAARDNYSMSALASDPLRLHEHFGGDENAVLIGHDWGATAAYAALSAEPHRWRRAVTMSVPPIGSMVEAFSTYNQLRMSWYMWFFQLPLADFMVPLNDFEFIAKLWRDWSPSYDAHVDVAGVRDALRESANTTAALTYYRQMFDDTARRESEQAIFDARLSPQSVATLYLHGDECGCISLEHFNNPLDYLAPGSRFEVISSAGHFVHLEQPDAVNQLIAIWLAT